MVLGIFHAAQQLGRADFAVTGLNCVKADSLEGVLRQSGFTLERGIETKRGAWEIFLRQNYAFAPFLPGEEGRLADSGAAVYTEKDSSSCDYFLNYFFMTAPSKPVNLEEIAKNAQHISSGIFESWPYRLLDWVFRDASSQGLKAIPVVSGGAFAGLFVAAAFAAATGNGDTGTGALMAIGGAVVGGASLPIASAVSYLLTSARVSNFGNYAVGKEATAALGADLAMLQKHQVAAKAYSDLTGSGLQMSREDFWEIFTGIQEAGFSLKKMGSDLLNRRGFGDAARVITPYASQFPA